MRVNNYCCTSVEENITLKYLKDIDTYYFTFKDDDIADTVFHKTFLLNFNSYNELISISVPNWKKNNYPYFEEVDKVVISFSLQKVYLNFIFMNILIFRLEGK